jgi:hypothetical protein
MAGLAFEDAATPVIVSVQSEGVACDQNYWRDLRRHDWRSPIAAYLDCHAEDDSMRVLTALLVIAYLVGVGVALAPTIKANWSTGPASQFVESVATELPRALSWPATVYRSIAEKPSAPEKHSAPE